MSWMLDVVNKNIDEEELINNFNTHKFKYKNTRWLQGFPRRFYVCEKCGSLAGITRFKQSDLEKFKRPYSFQVLGSTSPYNITCEEIIMNRVLG